ncbi:MULTISPECIES: hypothetical protein [Rhizobium/Agrobacterium group]|uniref:hypothetical protein n=1 Tax=Rhizobium/Agrobacterium group TaxID=227290 RepID=UPI0011B935A3|nr:MULTISPECIES: hypothetical protein [Rhizobium/Agrobacterium group]
MAKNVYKFRRIKWGDPRPKLKVLVEDFKRAPWIDRLSSGAFVLIVALAAILAFAISVTLTHLVQ